MSSLDYLKDQFLNRLMTDIQKAGIIKAASIDITDQCNLRCKGCYYYSDNLQKSTNNSTEEDFDKYIESEKERGTNFFTVLGGEPSLVPGRLKKLYDNFNIMVVTNGVKKIPYKGFEKMPIAISIWGDHETDKTLRGSGKIDTFQKGLDNYKNDDRVSWYYTTMSGNADDIESVTEQCISNGNYLGYNFYGDISGLGDKYDHRKGFKEVSDEINRMILKYPDKIFNTSYLNKVVCDGQLYGEKWGYHVCSSITSDHEDNAQRILNGKFYNKHFRAYNADFKTTRKCCVGQTRDCSNCYDLWAHFSWIMSGSKKHYKTKENFTHWLTTIYLFYLINRLVDFKEAIKLLPELHERSSMKFIM